MQLRHVLASCPVCAEGSLRTGTEASFAQLSLGGFQRIISNFIQVKISHTLKYLSSYVFTYYFSTDIHCQSFVRLSEPGSSEDIRQSYCR